MKEESPMLHSPLKPGFFKRRWKNRGLYLLIILPTVYVILFNYIPIYGVVMAFQRYTPRLGIISSPWVGFYQFQRFFTSPMAFSIIRNTLVLSFYSIIAGFPLPLLMAIFINHCIFRKFKKIVQSITFAPYFLSTVILVGLVMQLLDIRTGAVNILLSAIGIDPVNFMGSPENFPNVFVWSQIWRGTGYSAVIYIAALSSVDPGMHEAAIIDGATLWQRVWHIDLPSIRLIILILVILSMGGILSTDFERAFLLQNPLNLTSSEVISTYVYKVGLGAVGGRPDYSFGTAIGLFQNVIGVIMVLTVNRVVNSISGEGLF